MRSRFSTLVIPVFALACANAGDAAPGTSGSDPSTSHAGPPTGGSTTSGSATGEPATSESTSNEATTDTGEPAPPVPGCTTGTLLPGDHDLEIEHDGVVRNWLIHVPDLYDGTTPTAVVYDFHAVTTNPAIEDLLSGMRAKADAEGFVVVQASGIGDSWNAGPACCPPANATDVDDVGFFLAMQAELEQIACVDPRRVFATGMSNGGYLSHRIGCEASDTVGAIAPVAASIGILDCAPTRAVPVFMVSGSEDGLAAKEASFESWRDFDGCTDEAEISFENGVFTCWTHDECDEGVLATHCIGEGVGHCWPSPAVPVLACSDDLLTTDMLWEFFSTARPPSSR